MSNLGRADVERIIEGMLKELNIRVSPSAESNRLTIELNLGTTLISKTFFSIEPEDYA